jgi:hypothetical protein
MPAWRAKAIAAVVALLAVVALVGVPTTTTAGAATFIYDAPPIARVGVHEFEAGKTSPAQLSGSWEGSASTGESEWLVEGLVDRLGVFRP